MIKLNKPKTLPWQDEALTVKRSKPFTYQKSVGAFLHKSKKNVRIGIIKSTIIICL